MGQLALGRGGGRIRCPIACSACGDQVKHKVVGGFPYSEGIYEDMNKAVEAQFYWNPDCSARETLREYTAYEFGAGYTDEVLALLDQLETAAGLAYKDKPVDADGARQGWEIAESVQNRMPDWARANWRWEILHWRALLDRERFAGGGLEGAKRSPPCSGWRRSITVNSIPTIRITTAFVRG